jgi:uncharacterized membrane protein
MFYRIAMEKKNRYWEIDLIRGIAVIFMIIYHICFDITFLNIIELQLQSLPFLIFLYSIGIIFLSLVGTSLSLRYIQMSMQEASQKKFLVFLKQGLIIFSLGMLITTITFFYPHNGFVVFGVLHCIGLSVILGYFFVPHPILSLLFGCILVTIGILMADVQVSFFWLVWLGLRPMGFYSLDYFPLLPWFGIVLIGIFLGSYLYPNGKRRFNIPDTSFIYPLNALMFLGRHSLPIYLIHQPIIFGVLFVFFFI